MLYIYIYTSEKLNLPLGICCEFSVAIEFNSWQLLSLSLDPCWNSRGPGRPSATVCKSAFVFPQAF